FDETVPGFIWSVVRPGVPAAQILNPLGDAGGDGAPSVVLHPLTGFPEAVWSSWDGQDHEIVWSRWNGAAWTTPLPLSQNTLQDLDPRLWIDAAGNRRIAWWRSGGPFDEVVIRILPPGETQWWMAYRLSPGDRHARHPDIRTTSWGTFVLAEEENGSGLAAAVYECQALDGETPQRESEPWGRKLLQVVAGTASLEPELTMAPTQYGLVPAATWREGLMMAISLYDIEALQWADPVLIPYPEW
ncbi:MAG TPA: hypothetical protein VJV23_03635, partial [Candidatus Polarisedimenticolia bacterium]|nr:hypothetical protein [Candidatus Polarisedimenticolia bacterium]